MLRALIMDYGGVLTDEPSMLDVVRRAAAAGHATALVSDADEIPAGYAEPFDLVVLGGTFEVRKPDPEIYELTLSRLGLPAEACVFDPLPGGAPRPLEITHALSLNYTIGMISTAILLTKV